MTAKPVDCLQINNKTQQVERQKTDFNYSAGYEDPECSPGDDREKLLSKTFSRMSQ